MLSESILCIHSLIGREKGALKIQELLQQLIDKHQPKYRQGKVADYISILQEQHPNSLAITVITTDKQIVSAGACPIYFTKYIDHHAAKSGTIRG